MLSNAWKRRQLRKAIKNKQLNPVPGNFSYRISTVGVLFRIAGR
ncbi:hypothetical protein ACYSNV_10700 [Myroides sp. LJL119]